MRSDTPCIKTASRLESLVLDGIAMELPWERYDSAMSSSMVCRYSKSLYLVKAASEFDLPADFCVLELLFGRTCLEYVSMYGMHVCVGVAY